MATFYVGYRPVLRGRDADNFRHTTKDRVGVYSNYELMDVGPKLLTGAPDNEYVLGTYKHARILEYIFAGKPHIAPMSNAGGGVRIDYYRYRPLEYKGLPGGSVFQSGYGHGVRGDIFTFSNYSNYVYDGLPALQALINSGHARRFNTSYGGAFDPFVHKGLTTAMANVGQALPDGYDNDYGKNKVNEWRGVPSARAL